MCVRHIQDNSSIHEEKNGARLERGDEEAKFHERNDEIAYARKNLKNHLNRYFFQ